jgi:hypothetical protein
MQAFPLFDPYTTPIADCFSLDPAFSLYEWDPAQITIHIFHFVTRAAWRML